MLHSVLRGGITCCPYSPEVVEPVVNRPNFELRPIDAVAGYWGSSAIAVRGLAVGRMDH